MAERPAAALLAELHSLLEISRACKSPEIRAHEEQWAGPYAHALVRLVRTDQALAEIERLCDAAELSAEGFNPMFAGVSCNVGSHALRAALRASQGGQT